MTSQFQSPRTYVREPHDEVSLGVVFVIDLKRGEMMKRLSVVFLSLSLALMGCGNEKLSSQEKQDNFEMCKSEFFKRWGNFEDFAEESCDSLLTAEQDEVDSFKGPGPWACEEGNDGLGKTLKCSSWTKDPNTEWIFLLTVMCMSDKTSRQGIMGLDGDKKPISWPYSDKTSAKIRIDSNPTEELKYLVSRYDENALEKGGEFLFFYIEDKTPIVKATGPQITAMSKSASKRLLLAFEGAKTFGFQAFDVGERMTSGVFNVDNQWLPISKFRELGCLD